MYFKAIIFFVKLVSFVLVSSFLSASFPARLVTYLGNALSCSYSSCPSLGYSTISSLPFSEVTLKTTSRPSPPPSPLSFSSLDSLLNSGWVCLANRYLEAIITQPFKRGCKSNDLLGFAAWVNLAFPGRGNVHISPALWTRLWPHICKCRSLLCVSWLILLSGDVLWPSLCFPKIKCRHMFEAGGWVLGEYIATVE